MTEKELSQAITDYSWMINNIELLRLQLKEIDDSNIIQRQRLQERLEEYERKVSEIQRRIDLITDDREQAILHWLLEGKSYRWIAELFNTSHVTVCGIKKRIVRKMLKG